MATDETKQLQETIDELKERLERLEKENAKLKGEMSWKPKANEDYFVVDGGRTWCYTNNDQNETDKAVAAGNCFKTRGEAEEFLTWLKARKTLLDDTNGFKPDWKDNNQRKFYVYYNTNDDDFSIDSHTYINDGESIWFETREDAKESIEKHEKEWHIYIASPAKKDDDDK